MMATWSPGLSSSLGAGCARRKGAQASVRASVMIRKFMRKAVLYHVEGGEEREESNCSETIILVTRVDQFALAINCNFPHAFRKVRDRNRSSRPAYPQMNCRLQGAQHVNHDVL